MAKKYVYGIAVIAAVLVILGLSKGAITGNFIKGEEPVVIYFPKISDFKNTEQGGINFGFSFPDAAFKVGEKEADFLLFLESETIPGLNIGYDPQEKKIKGGLPILVSPEVNILDGKNHNIIYTFHRGYGKQMIVLDDAVLVEGMFSGENSAESITGYAVYSQPKKVMSNLDIKI